MSYLEELLPEFRKGAKIRCKDWHEGAYIYCKCEDIWNQDDQLVSLSFNEIRSDKWELYQEPIDWDYIIKNNCLCWFWDGSEEYKNLGYLIEVNEHSVLCRYSCIDCNGDFHQKANCRPVERDEVNFYEDREDE